MNAIHTSGHVKKMHLLIAVAMSTAMLAACGGGGSGTDAPVAQTAECSTTSMASQLGNQSGTTVLLAKQFRKGQALPNPTLESVINPTTTPTTFEADLCMVKLLVAPGKAGPVGAPSTSAGIGIEIWLPEKNVWNHRYHGIGGSNWSGGDATSLTKTSMIDQSGDSSRSAISVASQDGSVTSSTDAGNTNESAAKMMNPDGSINAEGWAAFSLLSLHQQAVQTKAVAQAYYGSLPRYSYFSGASGGGRQGMQIAQKFPDDYDGILVAVPGVNWLKFQLAELWPQLVVQQDLGGQYISTAQMDLVGKAAIAACDVVNGQHLGFIIDNASCHYNPTKDQSVLCKASGGSNASDACVSPLQATAINKMWYGPTVDGNVPDPAIDNGWNTPLTANRLWFGMPRGTKLYEYASGPSGAGLGKDVAALLNQNPRLASPSFVNGTGNGQDGWKHLGYREYANTFALIKPLQPQFSEPEADNPDLSAFKARGGKLLHTANINDGVVFSGGSVNYYERVLQQMGGAASVKPFYRFYLAPGLSHALQSNGTTNKAANPPAPGKTQMLDVLTAWVENGVEPQGINFTSPDGQKSLPFCEYPAIPVYQGGDIFQAASYRCS